LSHIPLKKSIALVSHSRLLSYFILRFPLVYANSFWTKNLTLLILSAILVNILQVDICDPAAFHFSFIYCSWISDNFLPPKVPSKIGLNPTPLRWYFVSPNSEVITQAYWITLRILLKSCMPPWRSASNLFSKRSDLILYYTK
jgi:hypothetical protein